MQNFVLHIGLWMQCGTMVCYKVLQKVGIELQCTIYKGDCNSTIDAI